MNTALLLSSLHDAMSYIKLIFSSISIGILKSSAKSLPLSCIALNAHESYFSCIVPSH